MTFPTKEQWQKWQAEHPKLAGAVVVAESAAVGAVVDAFANGIDFSKGGLKHLVSIAGTAMVMAVRNYIKSNASDLKTKNRLAGPNYTPNSVIPTRRTMKNLLMLCGIIVLLCLLPIASLAQTAEVSNLYAAGISYNAGGSPAIAGTGLWAHKLADTGTYAFTAVDALPATIHPFVVTTNFSAGIAQKVLTLGKVPIYVPASAGVSFNGTNTGWAWTTGALASISLKGNMKLCPNVRLVKSSVSGGTGYQPVVGILFGWGQ